MSVTPEMIDCWRVNYGLDTQSPSDAMNYWSTRCAGMAPAGAVAALGLCIEEIERLRAALRYEQHLSERIGTHVPGCETWGPAHYDCAVRELERARKEVK